MSSSVMQQFLRFAVVGGLGFLVDAGVLLLMLRYANGGLYLSRLVSFICAATFTWAANRLYTFRNASKHKPGAQWLRFVLVNGVGGFVNLGTYAWLVAHWTTAHAMPVIAVAAGSIAGLAFNFVLSRSLVFRD